jgi:hypothetical protein
MMVGSKKSMRYFVRPREIIDHQWSNRGSMKFVKKKIYEGKSSIMMIVNGFSDVGEWMV